MKIDIRKFEIILAEKEMTLKMLGEKAKIAGGQMDNYCGDLRYAKVGKIAKALGVSVKDIIEE